MNWRAARPEDDVHVIRMSHALYDEDPSPEAVPPANISRTLEQLRREPARGMAAVLEIDRNALGYALLISFWSNELGGEVCTIDEVYVDTSVRSRGHMTALAESIIRGDQPWGRAPVAIELEVSPKNARARVLYERLGFKERRNSTLRRR